MATKKLSKEILSRGTGLSGILEKGYNPDSYTVKELSTIFTRQRDITRKTLTRYEKVLEKTNTPNKDGFHTILLDKTTGEVLEKSDYMRTLKDLKKQGLSEDDLKKAMLQQITQMNKANETFSLGTKKEQKADKQFLSDFNKAVRKQKYPENNPNPVQNRGDRKSAEREIKNLFRVAQYKYHSEIENDDPENMNNGFTEFKRIIQDTLNQQYHHAKQVFTLSDITDELPAFRKLLSRSKLKNLM